MRQILGFFMAIVLWVVAIILSISLHFPWLLIGLSLLHLLELVFIGLRTGNKFGKPVWQTILLTMLFGFIWWLPLRKRMAVDDLSDADFIEDGLEPWREVA